ncbi:hypothetical protein K0A97_00730 [Patescibacteria group bacterium]|nr:hypothetical protein [Patescibacteria group bacterium]
MAKRKEPPPGERVILLSPNNRIVKIKGKIHYSEGAQSWNIIRLKKEILYEFPELKEKSSNFGYTMIIPKSKESFKELLSEIEQKALPIFLFLNKSLNQNKE